MQKLIDTPAKQTPLPLTHPQQGFPSLPHLCWPDMSIYRREVYCLFLQILADWGYPPEFHAHCLQLWLMGISTTQTEKDHLECAVLENKELHVVIRPSLDPLISDWDIFIF